MSPSTLLIPRIHRRRLGSSLHWWWLTNRTPETQVTFHSIARLGDCVAISLGKICWMSSKLVGEIVQSLSLSTHLIHRLFSKVVSVPPVIAARVSGVPVFILNLTPVAANKSPINLRLRCIRHLSRLLVSQKSSMWGQWQRFRIQVLTDRYPNPLWS